MKYVYNTMHFCTMNHEKKTVKSCNPEILHHDHYNVASFHQENKIGKKYSIHVITREPN